MNNILKTGIGLALFSWLVGDKRQEGYQPEKSMDNPSPKGVSALPPKCGRQPNPERLCRLLEEWATTCAVCGQRFNKELTDTLPKVTSGMVCPFCKKTHEQFGIVYKVEDK